ncbi:MAG TPA: phosphomannomutase/phosphoglucomutase [Steroidobacteraceae bacterium]|jgi:phosphomannomutase
MNAPSHSINPAIVRAYDLRGVVGHELGCSDAIALGLAYATAARAQGRTRIAVARDGRLSSPELEAALLEGLTDGGLDVTRLGLAPTPQLHFAIHALEFDGGIMVTGSHNPPDENGFKLVLGKHPVHGRALRELVAIESRRAAGGRASSIDVGAEYASGIAKVAEAQRTMHIIWDCGNGAVGAVISAIVSRLPGRHIVLNGTVDGRFPAHHPDPAVAENLCELQTAVLARRADLGIAFDGDGDRIGIVDDSGAIVWPDQLLLLLAREALAEHPGATIVADVKSSRVLFDGIERLGGRPVMAPSGYVLVRDAMLRERAPLGGEMSGHIIYERCWNATGDALHVAVRTINAVASLENGLAAFRRSLPATCTTPEIRFPCPAHRKAAVMQEITKRLIASGAVVNTLDGVRVSTDAGWWLLRASGTESKLTARCEAADGEGLAELIRTLARQLETSGLEVPADLRQAAPPSRPPVLDAGSAD